MKKQRQQKKFWIASKRSESLNDCGLDKLLERSLRVVERDYLGLFSCENCARNKDDGGCPKSYLCCDTFTKPAFKEKEEAKEE